MDSAESAGGRLGAVLALPRTGLASLGPHGPWVATTPALARRVLTEPGTFDFPGDVSRSGDLSASRGDTRSGHLGFAALGADAVARGTARFTSEWDAACADHERSAPGTPYDAMALLRAPVGRATCAAVLPEASEAQQRAVADRVLAWIDALGPVIAARRPPARWSRTRRTEQRARHALEDTLREVPGLDGTPQQVATMLAAGIQVPIAAGAWLLAWLADHPTGRVDPVHAAWETVRLTPPTWVTARQAARDCDLDGQHVPAGGLVMVSPLLLGRRPDLVPGEPDDLARFAPERWDDPTRRPGAWLPFGAGPHACPGRNLGLAMLVALASWGVRHDLRLVEPVRIDQSRGIAPLPCRIEVATTEVTT
ncbi:cytochrome P450 [Nocardioides sp. J2M5]|uniref:cytochrome P450 n=1 Tax=Nocardioides palaemonis TaxID=2829810 RepID=UPI001BADF56B|nr:cytochrome P450 [Nocardioides palaemonis]MBS2936355.1 cytochrome P450 [Nocardioides palaemonis]